MLCKPVKLEGSGLERRVLEVRVCLCAMVLFTPRWLSAMMQTVKGEIGGRCFLARELPPGLLFDFIRQHHPLECTGFTSPLGGARCSFYGAGITLCDGGYARLRLLQFDTAQKVGLSPRCLQLALSTNAAPGATYSKTKYQVSQVSLD